MRSQLHERIEHSLQVEGRAADNFQHVGGGGLLLKRFAQIARARLHLIEQAHVLDCDHRLVGESRNQLNLLFGKRSHRLASDDDHANRNTLSQQRNTKYGTKTAKLHVGQTVFRIGQDVGNMNDLASTAVRAGERSSIGGNWMFLKNSSNSRRVHYDWRQDEDIAVAPKGKRVGLAQTGAIRPAVLNTIADRRWSG